jgi:hypothetical protein
MPSSYVSGRVISDHVISDQTEHSRAIIVGYVPSGSCENFDSGETNRRCAHL